MSNADINVDRRTDGRMDGQKIGRLYRTLLQAGAIIKKKKTQITLSTCKQQIHVLSAINNCSEVLTPCFIDNTKQVSLLVKQ